MVKQQDSPTPSSESGSLSSASTNFPSEKAPSLLNVYVSLYASPSAEHGFESPAPFSYKEKSIALVPSPAPAALSRLPSPAQERTTPWGSPPTPWPVHSPSNLAGPIAYPPPPAPSNYPPVAPPAAAEPGPSASPLSPRNLPIYSTPDKSPQPWKLPPPIGGLNLGHTPSSGASGFAQPFGGEANGIHRHYEAIVGLTIGAFFLFAVALLLLALFFVKRKKYPLCFAAPNVADGAAAGHGLKRSGSSLSPATPPGGGTSPGMLPSTEDGIMTRNAVLGAKAASSAGTFSAGKRKAGNNGSGIAQREATNGGGLYDIIGREDSRGPARSLPAIQHTSPRMEGPEEVKLNCCLDGQEAESFVVIGSSQRNGLESAERPLGSGDRCNRQGKSVRTRNFGNNGRLK